MKTKILLFALLCGALNAADSRYATGLAKPSPSKDFVSGFESGVRYGLIAHIDRPDEDDIPTITDNAKKLYFQIVADEGKTLIADSNAKSTPLVTVVDFPQANLGMFTMPAVPSLSYADGWFAAYIDGWTINEFHRRADELKDDDDQAELERIWAEIKTLATNMESGWAKLTNEQKASMAGPAFWKRNVGLPRRLSKSQNRKFVEALSK